MSTGEVVEKMVEQKRIYLDLVGLVEAGFTGMDLWVLSPSDPRPPRTIVLHQDDGVRVAVRHHTEEADVQVFRR